MESDKDVELLGNYCTSVFIDVVKSNAPAEPLLTLGHPVAEARARVPVLRPVRRIVPTVGGVDLSVLVLIIVLQVGLMLLG